MKLGGPVIARIHRACTHATISFHEHTRVTWLWFFRGAYLPSASSSFGLWTRESSRAMDAARKDSSVASRFPSDEKSSGHIFTRPRFQLTFIGPLHQPGDLRHRSLDGEPAPRRIRSLLRTFLSAEIPSETRERNGPDIPSHHDPSDRSNFRVASSLWSRMLRAGSVLDRSGRGDSVGSLAALVNHRPPRRARERRKARGDGRNAPNVGVWSETRKRTSEMGSAREREVQSGTDSASVPEEDRARAERAETSREGSSRYSMVSVPSRRGSGLDVASP